MIKFWKSEAKGKSGCPVRPPESSTIINEIVLDTNSDDKYEGDKVFEKNSILTLTLKNVLVEKKGVKYFEQFMETIGKQILIKCWLELDHFKYLIRNNYTAGVKENDLKLTRAKSLETESEKKQNEISTWSKLNDKFLKNGSKYAKGDATTSSCSNLQASSCSDDSPTVENTNVSIDLTEEAINIFKKYIALEAPYPLTLSEDVRKLVISNICSPEGQLKEDCFKPAQDLLFNQIENNYFTDFQNSPLYLKAQVDILTNSSLSLNDILYNDSILFYFTEYLEQESCSILLEFLMAVMHFRDNLLKSDIECPNQAQDDAIVLYDKYCSLQAIKPIGFSSNIRLKIETDICTTDGGPLPTCFDLPFKIVHKTLSKYVNSFIESEVYYKYLSEMIHSVDLSWNSNRKSYSDCSSEFSVSTQNTLLAMGDNNFHKKKRNHSVPDMTIDSNQLYNADALWQRKKHDGLSIGRINSLGRFESKFEPDPDKKDKSVFKRIVNRFVPTNSSKVDEEMAWQVAQMIVKNVTDLTMAPPENENE